jgi:uncharacterized protein YndB with AHSA1/START domain
MTATATGRHVRRDGLDTIVFERRFTAPIRDVWAAITEPDRLVRWIGTWSGDPASGTVQFRMTAEAEDAPETPYEIRTCEPPRRLAVHSVNDYGVWDVTLELDESPDAGTTLTFSQVVHDPATIENVGPGWDYYLDRLVAAETGTDVGSIDFEADYYPALRPYYLEITERLTH